MSYRFLRHLRLGVGTLITQREGDAVIVARPAVPVSAAIEHTQQWTDPATIPTPTQRTMAGPSFALYGPGDVVAIDRRQIVRETPVREALDADPDQLCAIEFRLPGLPWLMTPFAPTASNDTLRPWIALVVVPLSAATPTPREANQSTTPSTRPLSSSTWPMYCAEKPQMAAADTSPLVVMGA